MDEQSRMLMGLVSTLMLALLTAVSIFMEVGSSVHASHVNSWPMVRGLVTYSAPEINGCAKGLRYSPKILYSYDINGRHFEGDQVQYKVSRCGTEEAIAAFTDKYPMGASLNVRVNPSSSEDAVAIAEEKDGQDYMPSAFWVFVFFSLLLASFAYFRKYRALSN